jgi:hypothetical protein
MGMRCLTLQDYAFPLLFLCYISAKCISTSVSSNLLITKEKNNYACLKITSHALVLYPKINLFYIFPTNPFFHRLQ